ncbi:MAG: asparagine synthase (glutamine-hydrolyzing) [Gemmatimonadales bacterium]|nr:asparagine synthase (glutamine-hydrolyzing) [Gemmatimonadales bacterium]
MCGIAGFAGWPMAPEAAERELGRMCGAIRHRGPDDEGRLATDGVALGMRRLSIIDVSGGHQPIANEDGTSHIVFNGELYNHHPLRAELQARGHVFRTRTDTESILHCIEEFGPDGVHRLRGMFGFAVWDGVRRQLVLARDRLGIKPLYLWETPGGGLAFASELRSFLALDRFTPELDEDALAAYLAFGYVPDPACIFRGVRKLPPGHLAVWRAGAPLEVRQYWDPRTITPAPMDEQEAVTELRRLLDDAVASHLEAEVPLGAFLSGGLDSSTVVALMARHVPGRVRTFSIGFDEADFNEADDARRVAEALGTEHHDLVVRPDADALIDHLVAGFDEPFADSSAIPTFLVSRLARERVTVALSGDGGDELFGGYSRYALMQRRRPLPPWLRPVATGLGRALPHAAPGRGLLLDLGRGREGRYAQTVLLPVHGYEGGVAAPALAERIRPMDTALGDWFAPVAEREFIEQLGLVDLATYLPGDILTKVDRMSMAVSLEARVPLLDHPLVEFAMALPGSTRIRDGQGKALFRKAITGIVPPAVLTKRKQGFGVPLEHWFRGPLRHRIEAMGDRSAPHWRATDPAAFRRIAGEHASGRRDHSHLLWRLLVLDLWLRHLDAGRLREPLDGRAW